MNALDNYVINRAANLKFQLDDAVKQGDVLRSQLLLLTLKGLAAGDATPGASSVLSFCDSSLQEVASAPEYASQSQDMFKHCAGLAGLKDGPHKLAATAEVPDLISAFQTSADYSSLLQHAASLDVASKAHDMLRRTQQLRAQQKAAGAVTSGSQHKPAQGPTIKSPPARPQQRRSGFSIPVAGAAQQHAPSQQHQQHAPHHGQAASIQQDQRKRDAEGVVKGNTATGDAWKPGSSWASARRGQEQHRQDDAADRDVGMGDAAAAPAAGGFQSARTKLAADMRKKGQQYSAMFSSTQAPRTGLQRPGKKPGAAGAGGGRGAGPGVNRNGFVPPFVQKALDGPGEEEGPYSPRVMELLAGPDGEIPEELIKIDPKLLELVCNEVLDSGTAVSWDDIAGLQHAKALVQELVVWPMMNPHLFTGARAPPSGLLLFGPPGTGKTLIGKAIASNIQATFFSISASSLTSKWIGEGEKMVRALFAVASHKVPSVIFIDEIDSILSARKSEGEHEASRRLKTEMLIQMEGCSNADGRRVLLIGATNRPEELDEAARRRMPKQLYIPLPCDIARTWMIERQLCKGRGVASALGPGDIPKIVARTAGYSGSDMRNLIQEACQGPVRDAVASHGCALAQLSEADLRAVVLRDFQVAAKAQKASVTASEVVRYEEYNARHGARYAQAGAGQDALEDEEPW